MSLKSKLFIFSLLFYFSCFSQKKQGIKVVPQLIVSVRNQKTHLAVILTTTNTTNNRYIFWGGYCFSKYLRIMKHDSARGWEEIIHPSIVELRERNREDTISKTITSYKTDYNTSSHLFDEWVLEDKGFVQGNLEHLDLMLNNEIVESGEINKIKKCLPPSFSLFFLERKSTHEQFWNMDFLLSQHGKYRIDFKPESAPIHCEFSFKGFQLISIDEVKFDSIEIVTK